MTQSNKGSRLFKRFLLAFADTHTDVLGDIAGVWITFKGELFLADLLFYQVVRKLSGTGIRDALFTFLLQDQGFLHLVGFGK